MTRATLMTRTIMVCLALASACTLEGDPSELDEGEPGREDPEGASRTQYWINGLNSWVEMITWDIDRSPPDVYVKVWVDDELVVDTEGSYKSRYHAAWLGPFKEFALHEPSTIYVRLKDYDPTFVNYDTTIAECERQLRPDDVASDGANVDCEGAHGEVYFRVNQPR